MDTSFALMSSQVLSPATKLGECQFSPNWHEQLVAVRLQVAPTDQAATHRALSELLGELGADNRPFDWRAEATHRANGQLIDREQWTPSLGEDNDLHSAGIARADPNLGGDGSFYVVARTGGGAAARNLHTWVLSNPDKTVGELIHSPEYRVAEEYSNRNARRICALIAGAVTPGAIERVIKAEPDTSAASGIGNVAPPVLAVPTVQHTYNTLTTYDVGVAAARHGGAVRYVGAESSATPNSHVLVAHGASDGFVLRAIGAERESVPLVPTQLHDAQGDNKRYAARQDSSPAAFKQHVYAHFLTRSGQPASSATRALWAESPIGAPLGAGDTRLVPYVLIVHGKPARSLTGGA